MKSSNVFSNLAVQTFTVGKNNSIEPFSATISSVLLEQTHSANFVEVTGSAHQTMLNTDAVFTQQINTRLLLKHADCLPVLLYHPSLLIGIVHAGRKSTEQQLLQKLLLHLKNNFNLTSELQLWFGPAICVDCYQVNKENNLHYDLIQKNTEQVRKIFSEDQATIIYSNHCTAHENDQFYSYRKEGKGVPMNWSGISLLAKTEK